MRSYLLALAAAVLLPSAAQAAPCVGMTMGAAFAASYSCNALGTPTGVTGMLGGVTFLNSNTLLVGGNANAANGYIAQIGVIRDAANHIIGFSGPSTGFAAAPYIDSALAWGPGGTLFASGYPNNSILQFRPGSTVADRADPVSAPLKSVGAIVFVPDGFAGAGGLKLISYNSGAVLDATLTADGTGTFAVTVGAKTAKLTGGPEGAVYVKGTSAGFGGNDSLLVAEYSTGKVGAYQVDANGNPIVASRQDFLSGLTGAEGAAIDPLTGDFIFSTFGAGNRLFVVSQVGVPEPATWAMLLLGFGLVGAGLRRRTPRPVLAG